VQSLTRLTAKAGFGNGTSPFAEVTINKIGYEGQKDFLKQISLETFCQRTVVDNDISRFFPGFPTISIKYFLTDIAKY